MDHSSDDEQDHAGPINPPPWPFERSDSSERDIFAPRLNVHPAREDPLKPYLPGEIKSLAGIAMRAFCIGAVLSLSLISMLYVLFYTSSPVWRAPFFMVALSTFHFLEFWTTAQVNTRIVTKKSFLLTANWPHYAIAHSAALLECITVSFFFPERNWAPFHTGPLLVILGLAFVVVGQTVRSLAMLKAGQSFNHEIQWHKAETHASMAGSDTRRTLASSTGGVLWWFFNRRISFEEAMLTHFFKQDYKDYRARVRTGIPFIR
ncbi:hypothetical protein Golomagni_06362 [Golovinomyces magnicellulatus]|nr:hypothetical protein Golomagni_06362 [Golovinomyces magnicellulatus]